MHVGAVLVAGGHAVSGHDGPVHDLVGMDQGRDDALGVHPVDVGVVEKPLGLEHVEVRHLGEPRVRRHGLPQGGQLEGLHSIRHGSRFEGLLGQEVGRLEPGDPACLFVFVLLQSLLGLKNQHYVEGLGEGGVIRPRAGHVHDTFLETHDLAAGEHRRPFQDQGLPLTHRFHVTQESREEPAGTLHLAARLHRILHRRDPGLLSRTSQVYIHRGQALVLAQGCQQFLLANLQDPADNLGVVTPLQAMDPNPMQFQLHDSPPFSLAL